MKISISGTDFYAYKSESLFAVKYLIPPWECAHGDIISMHYNDVDTLHQLCGAETFLGSKLILLLRAVVT